MQKKLRFIIFLVCIRTICQSAEKKEAWVLPLEQKTEFSKQVDAALKKAKITPDDRTAEQLNGLFAAGSQTRKHYTNLNDHIHDIVTTTDDEDLADHLKKTKKAIFKTTAFFTPNFDVRIRTTTVSRYPLDFLPTCVSVNNLLTIFQEITLKDPTVGSVLYDLVKGKRPSKIIKLF